MIYHKSSVDGLISLQLPPFFCLNVSFATFELFIVLKFNWLPELPPSNLSATESFTAIVVAGKLNTIYSCEPDEGNVLAS